MRIAEEASSTWAPSMAATQHNFDSPYRSQDMHYALHGKVTMLVLILIFCIFLLLLSFLPCLRRRRRLCGGKSSSVPFPWECCPLVRKGKDGSGAAPSQTEKIPKDNTGRLLYF